MLLLDPVEPFYDESYPPSDDPAAYFEPPRSFVEDYWDWGSDLAGPFVPVHTGRLIPRLRAVAARRDAELALVDSAIERVRAARLGESEGPTISLSNAFADLSVSGRAAYRHFLSIMPTEDSLLSAMIDRAASTTPPLLPRPTEVEARLALQGTLDRAYTVVWALTGSPAHRRALRPPLGWIAVSGEDDAPHSPVNVSSTVDPMGEINFADMGQPIACRVSIKLANDVPALPGPDAAMRSVPIDARRQFDDLIGVSRNDNYDELILFIHGLGSKLEEGDRFKQMLIDYGRARGKRYAVLSIDLPGFGYSSRLNFDAVVRSRPAQFDLRDPFNNSSFPFLTLYRDCLAQLSNRIVSGIQYAVGGSLGGNLVLRLAEIRNDGRYILPGYLRKFVSWSPASIWESYERSRTWPHELGGGTHIDSVKNGMKNRTRDRMNTSEVPGSRHDWFDVVQRGELVDAVRYGAWGNPPTKESLLNQVEVYGPEWRRTFWAVSHEQLIFSHQEPLTYGRQWPFRTINRPLYILSGERNYSASSADWLLAWQRF